ncbi:ribosomal P protein AGP2beta-1, putative [Trypanosoma brucei gambiense DAL972]|uniref:Ribosomal P protein AGP2beta-1, putative n=1 Tax=Trypanosoma brucei gambiense (strain MHOM/CI/86/DAL972) TaxID=679716 RepID=C9ZRI6_TRYB9|nr:ribosomal P protein AGP2beta-1, putative [Trypanosoma brucei gambiense DAL972]CBH12016.1 ribosomal P protein AGP2beta-1, putative [Trypanosoma brucei gambiense DAL972]|eukprot:XP_011774301.1 ribosomal P protein AGP2beta-1, putative [Trypanosoma brucei gambiense DAL972]
MALQLNKDKYNTNELSMASLVALCSDCKRLCVEKTGRMVENMSRAPRGWEEEYTSAAEKRRGEDFELCHSRCLRVTSVCPSPTALEWFESLGYRRVAEMSPTDGIPTIQQVSRCEYALTDFTNVLFSLAHKPSKVMFDKVNPKTGERLDREVGGESSDIKKPVLGAGSIDEAILNRWSSPKRGRRDMEDLGLIRSPHDSTQFKRELERQDMKVGGTTPRW